MNNTIMAFLLTLVAGLSTMIGSIFIFVKRGNTNKIIMASLAFASGVMICVSITDLIPESIKLLNGSLLNINILIISFLSVLLGVITSMLIDYYLPDKPNIINDKKLYRVGFISMIAIVLHNIPEGIATFMATSSNVTLGISLATVIAMHNIPEGISISIPIYYSTKSKKKAIFYTGISALSEPLGAIIAYLFLKNIMNDIILGILFSLIAGIMMQISLCELLPTARSYSNSRYLFVYFIIGVICMLIRFII